MYLAFYLQKGRTDIMPYIWGGLALLWLTPILNSLNYTTLARILLIMIASTCVFVISCLDAPGPPYPFFAVVVFPFVLFDTKKWHVILLLVAVLLIYYFIYDFYYDYLSTRDVMHYFIIYSTFGLMLYALSLFFNKSNKAERDLQLAKDEVDEAHEELSQQHEELVQTTEKLMATQNELFESQKILKEEKDRAEDAARVKEQFLSSMSHELRTPLNGIVGFADYLQITKAYDETSVQSILYSAEKLSNILGDILAASADEYGELKAHMGPVKVAPFLNELFKTLERNVSYSDINAKLNLAKGLPEEIICDETKMFQIISNLQSNAVKHTEEGSVTLSAKVKGGELKISITDTGSGIPPENQEAIFDKFRQLSDKPGTGLGLYICKRLADVIHGEVSVKSSVGVGSVFTLSVPLTPPNEIVNLVETKLSYSGKSALVIEDDEMSAQVLEKLILFLDMDCLVVDNGDSALEVLDQNKFDVVFSDLELPGVSGVELIKGIRSKTKASLAVVSALNNEVGANEITRAGADVYFVKPLERKKVFQYLDMVFTDQNTSA